MVQTSIRPLTIAALALLPAARAGAADADTQLWTSLSASADVGSRGVINVEGHLRLTDGASRGGQAMLRPSIGLKLDPNTTASLGYAYVRSDPVGPALNVEHRSWQNLSYRLLGDGKGVTLTGRSRLEQRWVERAPGMGWRYRQQLRLTAPLAGKVRAAAWSEAFVALDDTAWGQRGGLDRWRNAVGVVVPLNRSLGIEPAYVNQRIFRPGQDRVFHIASIALSARF